VTLWRTANEALDIYEFILYFLTGQTDRVTVYENLMSTLLLVNILTHNGVEDLVVDLFEQILIKLQISGRILP
jgi:hypothetical protein